MLGILLIAFSWSLMAGIIGKIFRNTMQLRLHWIFFSIVTGASIVVGNLTGILSFNLNSEMFDKVAQYFFATAFIWLLLHGLFTLSTTMSGKRRFITTTVIASLPICIAAALPLITDEEDQWSGYAVETVRAESPVFVHSKSVSIDTYIESTSTLFSKVDEDVVISARRSADKNTADDSIVLSGTIAE